MKILGIETSCDETAASVVEIAEDKSSVRLLSTVTATSLYLHAQTGGIIPEVAARNQIKDIIPVIYEALEKAELLNKGVARVEGPSDAQRERASEGGNERQDPEENFIPDIDAIAVTYGPGLIGSLLVGVETAKTLSYVWNKPLIPVNHLFGHLYANWIGLNESGGDRLQGNVADKRGPTNLQQNQFALPSFPAIGLVVSGGHTDLVLMKSHTDIIWLGGTRDDAAGEAFDKIGRMLGLPYPAGPAIEKLAHEGNPKAYHFTRPLMYDKDFDFSFSGLKTAVFREVQKVEKLDNQTIANICRATQDAIIDVIVYKTLLAAEKYNVLSIILGGGVAANSTLRETLQNKISKKSDIKLFVPTKSLCTDNAVMIALSAVFQQREKNWKEVTANPELYFD